MIIKPHQQEILRNLGIKGDATPEILEQIDTLTKELQDKLLPKHTLKRANCTVSSDMVTIEHISFKTVSLAKHLANCNEVIILSATLGIVADNLLRRYSVADIAKAAILQSICAAMIEEYCDNIQESLAHKLQTEGLYFVSRFSPGYGDFSITYQKEIITMLNCNKAIGLTVSDSFMLNPTKSVTAIIGITDKPCKHTNKCNQCNHINCEFRRQRNEIE